MKARASRKLVIPTTLAVTVLALASATACVTACTTSTSTTSTGCVPVLVADAGVAGVRTYECKDGRACDPPDPAAIDGGLDDPYQVCPGSGDCATLVAYDGTSESGFC